MAVDINGYLLASLLTIMKKFFYILFLATFLSCQPKSSNKDVSTLIDTQNQKTNEIYNAMITFNYSPQMMIHNFDSYQYKVKFAYKVCQDKIKSPFFE